MADLFKNKNFKIDYKHRQFDEYKNLVSSLPEETKKELDRKRTRAAVIIILAVFIFIIILAVTGVGVDKSQSNVFVEKEDVLIECFGDSFTYGVESSTSEKNDHAYPKMLGDKLEDLLAQDNVEYKCKNIAIKNYGIKGSCLENESYKRLSGNADIVIILYGANNIIKGEPYEGTLETNIKAIKKTGARVYLLNYPIYEDGTFADSISQANNYISKVANSENIELVDLEYIFKQEKDQSSLFGENGLYLTSKGYELISDTMANKIHIDYVNMQ